MACCSDHPRHIPPSPPPPSSTFLFISLSLLLLILILPFTAATPESDAAHLLQLKQSLGNSGWLQSWIEGTIPCPKNAIGPFGTSWMGVLCFNGTVWGLKLEEMELQGEVDMDALSRLPFLRILSVMRNRLEGPIPMLSKAHGLKSVFLSDNRFSGEIPEGTFDSMRWLKKVHLARNAFEGPIPPTLTGLPRLLDLKLEENQFEGEIPEFKQPELRYVNLSYNKLEGPIPAPLGDMDVSSFAGQSSSNPSSPPCSSIFLLSQYIFRLNFYDVLIIKTLHAIRARAKSFVQTRIVFAVVFHITL